ncbi:ligase-associated DNA damage response endonuclease PdeM [Cecembia calidifontis]|jgi:DNA ligase-associated metallophosphoesterase|uniref:Putative phosphoesterase n=1 Tax=Cecembia calidifontis TaxID=1187080 RepID=A0A4Q7PCX9_9BACT|nr:ligase-associated DNA damage response endonuclease PdeM [Cecembia calidifontis]RZS98085.1 putative phosphoesterase [Cecembia calidifontis]
MFQWKGSWVMIGDNLVSKKDNTDNYFEWKQEEFCFQFLPEKAVYLPDHKALLIADPHFGKAAHFRKAGVPVPETVHSQDYQKIKKLIELKKPQSLIFLGDLFHSDFNTSWFDLEAFRSLFSEVDFHLVKGNHDILPEQFYRSGFWHVHNETMKLGKLILSHEPLMEISEGNLNLCGHIHPGISLYGSGRQKLTLPCFHVSPNRIILPAFGRFTGLAKMPCEKNDRVFAITGKKVIPVNFMP